jgi:hypothetical protein
VHVRRRDREGDRALTRQQHSTPLISIYDGRACVGFVLARGPRGFEAFGSDAETSLGTFKTQAQAINK